MQQCDRMILFDRDWLSHQFIEHFAARTRWEGGINQWCRNHDRNIHWMFWSGLLWNTWLGISLEVQRMVRRLISVLRLRLSSINLGGMMSVFLQLERSEPTTQEVTSARVQKYNLSTMLSKRANSDLFSNSNTLALNSNLSIQSFKASISTHC